MAIQTNNFKVQTPKSGSSYYEPGSWPEDEHLSWLANENCYLLTCPVAGETTENSERTRVEFRQCEADGDEVNFLVSTSHVHRVAMRLLEVCSNGKVVIGQIHVKDNSRPPLKVFFDNEKIRVGFRPTFNMTDDLKYTLVDGVRMNDYINFSIINVGDGVVKIYLSVNGVGVYLSGQSSGPAWTGGFDGSWNGQLLYSKNGVYNQLDSNLSTGPNDRSVAKLYKMEVA